MTTINNIQDLIQLLRDQPIWAEELRGILLSTELRDLPAAVRELAQALTTTAAQTDARLTTIEADIATMKGDISTMQGDISTMQGDIGRLKGSDYEQHAVDKAIHRAYADLGFTDPRPVKASRYGFQAILSSALARARQRAAQEGRTLPELTQDSNFIYSDIIIADMGDPDARERRSPPVAYALFEASITADSYDIHRARARSETMAATLQVQVTPAVITATAPEPVAQEAAQKGVALFLVPEH